jgi:fucokinase
LPLPSFSFALQGYGEYVQLFFDKLDAILIDPTTMPDVAARTLAQVGELLAAMAGKHGGLRSGPARNARWKPAFELLAKKNDNRSRVKAVKLMRDLRTEWIAKSSAADLIRAARHYEGAGAVLIAEATQSATQFIDRGVGTGEKVEMGKWCRVDTPARVDISGGWTDMPPISYEHGGAVTNIAVKVDGKRPIGARVRRIPEPELRFQLSETPEGGLGALSSLPTVVCTKLDDMLDYFMPSAPCALLKAAILVIKIVDLDLDDDGGGTLVDSADGKRASKGTLKEQLMATVGGGLHIATWSNLPTGSGLGTSSILAGALLGALGTAVGRPMDHAALCHAVLKLEQMLTTGGGWQDQVGGLYGGIKICRSNACLPLEIVTEPIQISEELVQTLNKHLLLIFTGRPR